MSVNVIQFCGLKAAFYIPAVVTHCACRNTAATFSLRMHLMIKDKRSSEDFSLEALRAGDKTEFARLVEEYSGVIYRLAIKMLEDPQDAEDVLKDPQLNHRNYFIPCNHPEIGNHLIRTTPWKFSRVPSKLRMPAPCLGEHTEYVCTHILGISDDDFITMFNQGIFE